MRRFPPLPIFAAIGWMFVATPAMALVLPDCAGRVEIAHAKVVRVEKNGALILSDGRAALLEGIRLPLNHAALGDVALDRLRQLAVGTVLTLTATRPKEDRYDRVRVQAFAPAKGGKTLWLQMEMLKAGLARVQISPDRDECAPDLYETESAARQARTGLWALPSFAVKNPSQARDEVGNFTLIEGRIDNVAKRNGATVIDFGDRGGFVAVIARDDIARFREMDPGLEDLAGRHVRLRGIVVDDNGRPRIQLSNPYQLEVLQ